MVESPKRHHPRRHRPDRVGSEQRPAHAHRPGALAFVGHRQLGDPDRGLKLSFPTATAGQFLAPLSRESGNPPQLVITYTPGPELPDFSANLATPDDRLRAELFAAPDGAATPFELVWNTKPGVRYRLPTEAEWEKAARGRLSDKRFSWDDTINHTKSNYLAHGNHEWYDYDTSEYTDYTNHPEADDYRFTPVKTLDPNSYGLYESGAGWGGGLARRAEGTEGQSNHGNGILRPEGTLAGYWLSAMGQSLHVKYSHLVFSTKNGEPLIAAALGETAPTGAFAAAVGTTTRTTAPFRTATTTTRTTGTTTTGSVLLAAPEPPRMGRGVPEPAAVPFPPSAGGEG